MLCRRPLRTFALALSLGISLAFGLHAGDSPPFKPQLPDENLYLQGRYVYTHNCEVCHGTQGEGNGPMGLNISPKPRNFAKGVFKYRSTPMTALPTNDDLMRTVRRGLSGASMPSFQTLPDKDVRAVVEYIKSFSLRWDKPKNYAPPVKLPAAPDWFDDTAKTELHAQSGQKLYEANCLACHGPKGEGDGPAAATLVDSWDTPIKAANLREPTLRSGPERSDLYRTLVTGVGGTPMASFAETTTPEQLWDLIAYLEKLRSEPQTLNR